MAQQIPHVIFDQVFILSAKKCMYWQQEQTLILTDLHFGKTGHFRKEGIAVPQNIYTEDVQCLFHQIQLYKPNRVIIIGDMFHSHANAEMDFFKKWRKDFSQLVFTLIKGNHDILQHNWYTECGIELINHSLTIGQFGFIHDVQDIVANEEQSNPYYFGGHIHPGIFIKGIAKQNIYLPCFYFTDTYSVLPAFSKFTGKYPIKPKRNESVYAITPNMLAKNELGSIIKIK
jgi:uncharacterized protein